MKIAYVITRSDAIGGVHIHVRDLCRALRKEGNETLILAGGADPRFAERLGLKDEPFVLVPSLRRLISPMYDLKAFFELRRILKQWRPDLVSTHSGKAGILGRFAAWSLGIPVIFTAHGWTFHDAIPKRQAMLFRTLEKLAGRVSDRILTVSESDAAFGLKHGVTTPDKLWCVHNGMPDLPGQALAEPAREPPAIIMVARFEEQKDHSLLVRALARLIDLPWSLKLVGDGPLVEPVRHEADALGLGARVEFTGMRRDVPQLLADSQIFALATNWEGFPRSILEAMRAGLPVVATDVAGVGEAVTHGSTGLLVTHGDLEGLTAALRQLIEKAALRESMGKAGRARYAENFVFEKMFQKTVNHYREVVAG